MSITVLHHNGQPLVVSVNGNLYELHLEGECDWDDEGFKAEGLSLRPVHATARGTSLSPDDLIGMHVRVNADGSCSPSLRDFYMGQGVLAGLVDGLKAKQSVFDAFMNGSLTMQQFDIVARSGVLTAEQLDELKRIMEGPTPDEDGTSGQNPEG